MQKTYIPDYLNHKPKKNKGGRPRSRTDEQIKNIQNEICNRIATTSKSLRQICQDMIKDFDKMPSFSTVKFMLVDDTEFQAQYAQAKAIQAELLFDEILEISDRILVLYGGEVMGVVEQKDATRNGLGLMMAGERKEESA